MTNDNGGTAVPSDWTLYATGTSGSFSASGSEQLFHSVTNGVTYTLSEQSIKSGYTAGSWSCVINGGIPQTGNQITLTMGQSAICTINNNDEQAYITVVKVVTNDNGGSAAPNDFLLTLEGDAVTSGVAVPVNPGTYTAG